MLKKIAILFATVAVILGFSAVPAQAAGPYYWYAGGRQYTTTPTYTMAAANFSVNNPPTSTGGGDHSIAEISFSRDSSGSYVGQAIEIGWGTNIYNDGDTSTRLWVGAWKNGAFSGYNPSVFVPYCATSPCTTKQAGDVLTSGGASLSGVKTFLIQYGNGNWWLAYDGAWIGYFPTSYWSGMTTLTAMDRVDFFGEVASNTSNPTCTDMGNSVLATPTAGATVSSATVNSVDAILSLFVTDAAKYNVSLLPTGSTKAFRYGGPSSC